jgi:hypothetical protein
MGFEPMIALFEGSKTVQALDRAATVIGIKFLHYMTVRQGDVSAVLVMLYI